MSLTAFHGRCPTCGYDHSAPIDLARIHEKMLASRAVEATKPQEPVAIYHGVMDCGEFGAFNLEILKMIPRGANLYTTPQPCLKCREWENKYLMEQAVNAGDGVLLSENERLKAKCAELDAELLNKEGMTCGDCNDTGWLENREEGRYPCTCMTEAEPYQILEAERDDWKSRYESNLSVNQMHSDNNAEMLKFNAKLLAKRDALAMQNQQMREALEYLIEMPQNKFIWKGSEDVRRVIDEFRPIANEALALPDQANIIKRNDAAVLDEVVERIIDAASIGGETGVEVVRTMIKEIGSQL